jgi:hypothetical protein
VPKQQTIGIGSKVADSLTVSFSMNAKKMASQNWDIFRSITECRQIYLYRVQPKVEIAPESAKLDIAGQVSVGGRNQPHIGAPCSR